MIKTIQKYEDKTITQDITVVEDYDVAYDEVNGTVNVLNGNAEIDEDGMRFPQLYIKLRMGM